jgi:prolyl 4-hydroxylase
MSAEEEAGSPTELAKRLLRFPPPPSPEAARVLSIGAQQGDGEAAYLLAVLAACGFGAPQDPALVLALLQRSVRAGFADSSELALLTEHPFWASPVATSQAVATPRILTFRGLIPEPVCAWLIGRSAESQARAEVYDPAGGSRTSARRTNSHTFFSLLQSSVTLALVRARVSAASGFPLAHMEDASVLRYRPGESFAPHMDVVPDTPAYTEEIAQFGRRFATCLVYLNDGFTGGETEFPEVGYRFRGEPGDAIHWVSFDASDRPDPLTLHAGLPVLSGEKWLLSQWIRDRPATIRGATTSPK